MGLNIDLSQYSNFTDPHKIIKKWSGTTDQ